MYRLPFNRLHLSILQFKHEHFLLEVLGKTPEDQISKYYKDCAPTSRQKNWKQLSVQNDHICTYTVF